MSWRSSSVQLQGRIQVWVESAPAPLLTAKSCKFSRFWGYISYSAPLYRHSAPSFYKSWIRPWISTPEVAAAVYFSSTLNQTWTELTKKYLKVTMKCLTYLHCISFIRRRILFSVAWIYVHSEGFCENRTKLLIVLISAVARRCHYIKCMVPCMVFFFNLLCCSQHQN